MAINIFNIPKKVAINVSMKSKSIMVVGKSKTGKSTIAAQASRPIFLMTENGGEGLVGFTPVPIGSWSDFKQVVSQLCRKQGREEFDTVVIDTYTNLILLLDKYIGGKLTTNDKELDFGSDADYGKGTKGMKNELGIQLQKLANQGYLLINIVHAEDKVDFKTQEKYIGTSLSDSLYGVAEKFVDQIIYLKKDEDRRGNIEHTTWFNSKGGYKGAGGRFTPEMDSIPTSYANIEKALLKAMEDSAKRQGAETAVFDGPSVIIYAEEVEPLKFDDMISEFTEITGELVAKDAEYGKTITNIVEAHLGKGKKVRNMTVRQAELLKEILTDLKDAFGLNEDEQTDEETINEDIKSGEAVEKENE